ncbi:MAG: hypothetical protein EA350_13805 [Gemmatimonadales bacterium]|nr:MAG: hypothetical protein EA350_13805 [Gemmatimonadales bacterium]
MPRGHPGRRLSSGTLACLLVSLIGWGCGGDLENLAEGGAADLAGAERGLPGLSRCIVLEPGVDLHLDATSPVGMGLLPQVITTRGGQILVHDDFASTGGGPLAFDSVGAFVGVVGGSGDGPGEFRLPSRIASDGDSIVLVHDRAHGLKVLTPSGSEVGRYPDVAYPRGGLAVLSDSLFVVGTPAVRPAAAPDRDLFAYDVRSGELVSAFGPRTEFIPGGALRITAVAPSGSHGVWAVTAPNRVHHFTVGDEHATSEVVFPSDWLAQVEALEIRTPADTGYVFHSVYEDQSEGVLWVLSTPREPGAPNPFESPVPGAPLSIDLLTVSSVVAHRRTVISAVHLARGEVIGHSIVDGLGLQFTPDGRLAAMQAGADFSPEIRLWRLRLSNGEESPDLCR